MKKLVSVGGERILIKALLLDIDNTLLNAAGELSPASKKAINRAQASGIQVILATARGYRSTQTIHRELQLTTPAVCHMGAMVYDYTIQKPIIAWPLCTNIAHELAQLASDQGIVISAYVGHEVWFNRMPDIPLRKDWVVQTDLVAALQGKSTLEMVVVDEKPIEAIIVAIKQMNWAKQVALGRLEEAGRNWLFITRAGISKASALDWLLPQLGLTWQDTAACGDGTADLEMIQRAQWGLAAPLAHPLVKEAAHAPFQVDQSEPIASLVQEILNRRGSKI